MKAIVSTVVVVLMIVFGFGNVPAEVPVPVDVSVGYVAYLNGDVDASGFIDISDAVGLLGWLYMGSTHPAPLSCEPMNPFHNGDVNGSGGQPDITDAINLLQWLFLGGPGPVEACPSV